MKFEIGKFYAHEAGRQIAILGEVTSYRWGKMFVIEEADKSGHSISCAEVPKDFLNANDAEWVEIGKDEWMMNFENASCHECGGRFRNIGKVVPTENGLLHETCFAARVKERGPQLVANVH